MIRQRIGIALVAAVGMLAGCSQNPAGKWESQSITPAMARDQFKLLRPARYPGEFVKASLELKKDKNYVAEVYYAGDMGVSTGTWSYDDGRLSLVDNKYGAHTYRAELADVGRTLNLVQPIKGTDVVLRLRRQK